MKACFNIVLCATLLLGSCMQRELDDNADYTRAEETSMEADNGRLLSRIFRMSNNAYLWFDINNEVAAFSEPSLTLRLKAGDIVSARLLPLRGIIYRYDENKSQLSFMRIPKDFVRMGDETLTLVFDLKTAEGDVPTAPLLRKETVGKRFALVLNHVVVDRSETVVRPEEKIRLGGDVYEIMPLTEHITLIN